MRTPESTPEEYCNVYKEFHLSLTRSGAGEGARGGGPLLAKCNTIAHFAVTDFSSSGRDGRGGGCLGGREWYS